MEGGDTSGGGRHPCPTVYYTHFLARCNVGSCAANTIYLHPLNSTTDILLVFPHFYLSTTQPSMCPVAVAFHRTLRAVSDQLPKCLSVHFLLRCQISI